MQTLGKIKRLIKLFRKNTISCYQLNVTYQKESYWHTNLEGYKVLFPIVRNLMMFKLFLFYYEKEGGQVCASQAVYYDFVRPPSLCLGSSIHI